MGLNFADIKNMAEHFRPNSDNKSVITFGRLQVFLHKNEIKHLEKIFFDDPTALRYLRGYCWGANCEELFASLFKCAIVDSLDISGYQGATIIHDLQHPISNELYGKYDLVVDGGTLEHIFNFPVAMSNALRLARVGGIVYSNTPSNNLSGHGFYQFSPELMYRVMSHNNGMTIILNRIGIAPFPSTEKTSFHPVYDVVNPDAVKSRVGLLSSRPVYMMIMARKTHDAEPFAQPVLQSDYVRIWDKIGDAQNRPTGLRQLFYRLPLPLQQLIGGCVELYQYSLVNSKFYRRVW